MVIVDNQILSFFPLHLSDAGQYICEVLVDNLTYNNSTDILIKSMYCTAMVDVN